MKLGYSFKELQSGMLAFIPRCMMPLILLLTIGTIVGTWCASGTIGVALMGVAIGMGINELIAAACIISA